MPRPLSLTASCLCCVPGTPTPHHQQQVQEYCDCGTLGGVASTWDMEAECDEQMVERLQLLRDTAEGLEALHQNHVVHGDIVSGFIGVLV